MNGAAKKARLAAGFKTQREAADATGVPQPKLSAYETGTEVPGPERARHIAEVYRTTVEACGWTIIRGPEIVVFAPPEAAS